jgi:hypothetical protein
LLDSRISALVCGILSHPKILIEALEISFGILFEFQMLPLCIQASAVQKQM